MKKRDIWISIAIIAAAALAFHFYWRRQGYIKIDTPGVELRLRSGWFGNTKLTSGAGPTKVKARVFRPDHLIISAEQNGNKWRIDGRGPWGELGTIKVKNNETTVLKPGPPFVIKPIVNQRKARVFIGLSIIGRSGERYHAVIRKNGKALAPPKLRITDEAGKVLASGKFEYG